MELTPEERKRIYEEEKTRLEAEETARRESRKNGGSSTGLEPNVAALLCYLGLWVTGIILLVLEQKNRFVRFHAAQSIVVFGALTILSGALRWVPFAGPFFSAAIGLTIFILWLVLMVKAYHGEFYRLPLAAEMAEWLLRAVAPSNVSYTTTDADHKVEQVVTVKESKAQPESPRSRLGEVVGSAITIALALALLIFLNFFNEYIAYYYQSSGVWVREPLLNSDFGSWLPVVTVALVLSIAGHAILIAVNQRLLRDTVFLVLDIFSLIVIGSLLSIFPFDFEVLPISASAVAWSMRLGLGIVMVIVAISVIVRFVKLVMKIVKA